MRRIGTAFILGGSLWLIGAVPAEAGAKRHTPHSHWPPVYESHSGPTHSVRGKEVSFEALRMLSTGMTMAEVLHRVGSPRHSFKGRGTQRWVYETTENWIVEVVFSGNNVIEVKWSRA